MFDKNEDSNTALKVVFNLCIVIVIVYALLIIATNRQRSDCVAEVTKTGKYTASEVKSMCP